MMAKPNLPRWTPIALVVGPQLQHLLSMSEIKGVLAVHHEDVRRDGIPATTCARLGMADTALFEIVVETRYTTEQQLVTIVATRDEYERTTGIALPEMTGRWSPKRRL